MNAVLDRSTFETSRSLEYFSQKELRAQIGYPIEFWPAAILRELIDNALDAAEGANILPEISITLEGECLMVADNGPGIPHETIIRSLDYLVRVSSKAYYVSPTRGQMGNALKVIYAAPFVSSGRGTIEIASHRERHSIDISLDRIAQQPRICHTRETAVVRNGTEVKMRWRDLARLLGSAPIPNSYNRAPTAEELIQSYACFNPHVTFSLNGETYGRAAPCTKWSPHQPTSAHWYTVETLRDLIAAYIVKQRSGGPEKTVREFVAEFRGLSSTAKQKMVTEGWQGRRLHDFVLSGEVDIHFTEQLLDRMQTASTAPPPQQLGTIGKEHLINWMSAHGVDRESIKYQQKRGVDKGLPYVFEVAFGINHDDGSTRQIHCGLNWSPVIGANPGDAVLSAAISEARIDREDPVTLVMHIARPRFQFADRGKTRVSL